MENKQSKHLQLYRAIKQSIASGTYKSNEKLPSEMELMQQTGFSRQTVRKALDRLSVEGLISKRQGMGSVVAAKRNQQHVCSRQVLLLVHYPEHSYFPKYISGIDRVLQAGGYSLSIKFSHNRLEDEAMQLTEAFERDYCGILLFPAQSAYLHEKLYLYKHLETGRIPCVLLCNPVLDTGLPVVTVDDYLGGYLAGRHLCALGHANIACFVNSDEHSARMRYAGFIAALQDGGVSYDDNGTVWFRYVTREEVFKEPQRSGLIHKLEGRTAAFCYNDDMALRLLHFQEDRGMRIPEDFSIVGYDDSYPQMLTKIGLTTVRQNPEEIGETAARNLLVCMQRDDFDANRVFKPELIVRESTSKPVG